MNHHAIYARVSTERQAEEQTIESQLSELREVCDDLQLITEYADRGWSGETLDRPELDRLRDDVRNGEIERVYIHSLDRLSRNLYQQGILVEELRKHNVEIFVKDKPIDFTGEGKLLFDLLGAVAEYEKWKILERTQRGRLYKARRGKVVGSEAPFGYRYVKKTEERDGYYDVDEEEAEVVRTVFDLYLKLGSVRGVMRELYARNIKPPKKGEHWEESTVHKLLRNETYIGTTYYNKSRSVESEKSSRRYRRIVKNGVRKREKSEWIPIPTPEIVDRGIFEAVQSLLAKNHRSFKTTYPYLLSGLVICGECESKYCGEKINYKPHYRCNNRHKRAPLPRNCKATGVKAVELEGAVWHAISQAVTDPKSLIDHISDLKGKVEGNRSRLEREWKRVTDEQRRQTAKKGRILELYSEGHVDKDLYLQKMATYERHEEELRVRLKESQSALDQVVQRPLLKKDVEHFCRLAKVRLSSWDRQRKRQFLMFIVEKIVYMSRPRKAIIVGHIPVGLSNEKKDETKLHEPLREPELGTMFMACYSREQYPKLRFEMEISV